MLTRPVAIFLWRRTDHAGHDSCRLFELGNGWRLIGAATFGDKGRPCHLQYGIAADRAWKTRSARVSGYLGKKDIDVRVVSAGPARWRVNGVLRKNVTGCIDVDLGFTPATNLIVLRRLGLKIGQRAEAPAAYLRFPEMQLVRLRQSYRRTGRTEYEYEAPTVGYCGTLQVLPVGAVREYPGLFELAASG